MLLPLNDLQGKRNGLAERDALKSDVQTREVEMITSRTAMKDSGRFTESVDQIAQLEKRECNFDNAEVTTKCNKETQTEMLKGSFIADAMEGE